MLATHEAAKADVTIAAKPVASLRSRRRSASCASTTRGRVVGFLEKPQDRRASSTTCAMDPPWLDARGIASRRPRLPGQHGHLPVQPRDAGRRCSTKTNYHDFGTRGLSRPSIRTRHVQLHLFDGYWEDIGTIRSFYDANLRLAQPNPPFELASATAPIYTRARFLPPTRVDGATIEQQPDRRRLRDRRRHADREQRHRPALPHRPQRDDSQLGDHGRRLLRNARPTRGRPRRRPPADRHRRRARHRRRDRRQELPHRRRRAKSRRGAARHELRPRRRPIARSATASSSSPKTASSRKAGTSRQSPRRTGSSRVPSCCGTKLDGPICRITATIGVVQLGS